MSNANFREDDVKTESSWTGPLRILVIVLVLSAAFLYYYFGPTVEDIQGNNPRASASDHPIDITVAGQIFHIPENYTQFGRSRRGGEQDKVELYAILPTLEGYSVAFQEEFEGNATNSPVVHFSLFRSDFVPVDLKDREPEPPLTERARFERVYLPHVTNPDGEPERYGFVRYELSGSWGYANEDLYVHERENGELVVFRCIKESKEMPSPWCRRDMELGKNVSLSYRFKRPRLRNWEEINAGLLNLVERFRAPPPVSAEPG